MSREFNAILRSEGTWSEVSSGLGKILLGYTVFAFGLMLAGACVAGSIVPLMSGKALKVEHIWMFYAGGAILKLATLTSWGMVISGQFRCLMNSTERMGARWIIFFCLTCVVMGPVLQYAAWIGGLATPIRWNLGPVAFQKAKFSMLGLYLLLASAISSGLYFASFWFFLLTLTRCLRASRASWIVGLFTALLACAFAGSAYLFFGDLHENRLRALAPWLAAGWVGVVAYWVFMIIVVKAAIDRTVEQVQHPLNFDDNYSQYELARS